MLKGASILPNKQGMDCFHAGGVYYAITKSFNGKSIVIILKLSL